MSNNRIKDLAFIIYILIFNKQEFSQLGPVTFTPVILAPYNKLQELTNGNQLPTLCDLNWGLIYLS